MSDELTVYVNDNPIGETDVYHLRKGHVTTLRRWRDRYIRETTAAKARGEGLRPCKQCFPVESGRTCPACGYESDGGACPNEDCRVETFRCEGDS